MGFNDTFKAISNPVRSEILDLLKEKEMTASDISSHFELSNATISHHLNTLKKCDLVTERKYKNYVIYQINTSVVEDMMGFLSKLLGGGKEDEESK